MPTLLTVDEDYGQLAALDDEDKQTYPLLYPAVLIELTEVEWEHIQGHNQIGEAKIRVRLVIDCHDDTHAGSGTEWRATERDRMRRELDVLLMGYRPQREGGLVRERSRFFTSEHGIKVYETHYSLSIRELVK